MQNTIFDLYTPVGTVNDNTPGILTYTSSRYGIVGYYYIKEKMYLTQRAIPGRPMRTWGVDYGPQDVVYWHKH